MTALLQGSLWVSLPSVVGGWCYLPDSPTARATVEVLVDGAPKARVIAAQRSDSPGDGRHGFLVLLSTPLEGAATRVIEGRECTTGGVFGRVVLNPERVALPIEQRLSALDCAALRRGGMALRDPLAPVLIECFRELSDALGRNRRWRLPTAPRLRLAEHPTTTLISPAGRTLAASLERLVAVQRYCDEVPCEILLADAGPDPEGIYLPRLVPGLRYARGNNLDTGAELNEMALSARGDLLCFIAPDAPPAPWIWPWQGTAGCDQAVHLGPAVLRAVKQLGARWQPMLRSAAQHGLAMAMPRAWFLQAGGFDPSLRGVLALADLSVKAGLLGATSIGWHYEDAVSLNRSSLLALSG
jgi:hypothetical protein